MKPIGSCSFDDYVFSKALKKAMKVPNTYLYDYRSPVSTIPETTEHLVFIRVPEARDFVDTLLPPNIKRLTVLLSHIHKVRGDGVTHIVEGPYTSIPYTENHFSALTSIITYSKYTRDHRAPKTVKRLVFKTLSEYYTCYEIKSTNTAEMFADIL